MIKTLIQDNSPYLDDLISLLYTENVSLCNEFVVIASAQSLVPVVKGLMTSIDRSTNLFFTKEFKKDRKEMTPIPLNEVIEIYSYHAEDLESEVLFFLGMKTKIDFTDWISMSRSEQLHSLGILGSYDGNLLDLYLMIKPGLQIAINHKTQDLASYGERFKDFYRRRQP